MSKEIKHLKKELSSLENKFFDSAKNKRPDQKEWFMKCQEKRKELMKAEIEEFNYNIAEDMRLIAEDFKEKYPGIASDALELVDTYSAKAKGEK